MLKFDIMGDDVYKTKNTELSQIKVMVFAQLRDMCELINDFYKYDKARFLKEFPHCCDRDLLDSVVTWHNVNVVKHGSLQQKEYLIQ